MSVVAVYAPTKVCETQEKEMFYAKLDSVLDQSPYRALIVLGDFNAITGTERAGHEIKKKMIGHSMDSWSVLMVVHLISREKLTSVICKLRYIIHHETNSNCKSRYHCTCIWEK